MFNSIKFKFILYFLVAGSVTLFFFSQLLYNTIQHGIISNTDTILEIMAHDIADDIPEYANTYDAKAIQAELEEEFHFKPLYLQLLFYDLNQQKILQQTMAAPPEPPEQNIFESYGWNINKQITFATKDAYRIATFLAKTDNNVALFIQTATPISHNNQALEETFWMLLIFNPLLLLIGTYGAYFLIKKTLQPMEQVVQNVKNIKAEELSRRINAKNTPLEIKELIDTFNDLLSRLEHAFERISQFSSDASHELKTPLTVIQGQIELGLRKERSAKEYKAMLSDMLEEIQHINQTIENLLFLAKTDTPDVKHLFEEIYLDEVLTEIVNEMQKFAKQKEIRLHITQLTPATITGSSDLLKIAFGNLIKNAINYSFSKENVTVTAAETEQNYQVSIKDQGIGIAPEEIPNLFERFYRSDKARGRESGGTGLGLSIVKLILDLHHFDIKIESNLQKGTTVIISIPKYFGNVASTP